MASDDVRGDRTGWRWSYGAAARQTGASADREKDLFWAGGFTSSKTEVIEERCDWGKMSQDACGESDLFSVSSEGFYHEFIRNSESWISPENCCKKVSCRHICSLWFLKKFKKPGELSHSYPERQTVVLWAGFLVPGGGPFSLQPQDEDLAPPLGSACLFFIICRTLHNRPLLPPYLLQSHRTMWKYKYARLWHRLWSYI